MNNRITRMMVIILAVLFAIAPTALADLERGDRGDDVALLQQLLFECGWLFELPDGIFGGNTEEAVRGFEEFAGLYTDGVADEEMIYELAVSLRELNASNGVISSYFGYDPVEFIFGDEYENDNEGYGEDGGGMEFALCCSQWTAVDGSVQTDYCEAHHTLHVETYRMLESGDADAAKHASELWYDEVDSLYQKWAEMLPAEEQGGVIANRATFLASIEAQRIAGSKSNQKDAAKIQTEVGICQNLRNQAVWLCGMIWQEKVGAWRENDEDSQAVVIDALTIIEGDKLYYSGLLEGHEETAVYVMNLDGSDCRKLADIDATLAAVSNGNLLVFECDDDGNGMLKILRADGTMENVAYDYNGFAIAEDGRFYYGGSSVAEDGSDHQWLLSSDPQYHDLYWPIDVVDGFLYYKDCTSGENVDFWHGHIPNEATLNRLNLMTGEIELLSGPGTILFGIEVNTAYYAVRDFSVVDEDGNFFIVEVEKGVYAMDLTTLETRLIAEETSDWVINEYYEILEDGILYGSCYGENGDYSLIRVQYDGTALPMVSCGDRSILIFDVADDVLYGHETVWLENEDTYFSDEYLVTYDFSRDEWNEVKLEADETIYYVEGGPSIRVIDGTIYYYVMNTAEGGEYLKSVRIGEGDAQTILTTGYEFY